MPLSLSTAPTVEPIGLAEAKQHLRLDGAADDALIDALIAVARDHAESATGSKLITQTWDWTIDCFRDDGCGIALPIAPVQSIASITYLDDTGATQTLASSVYKLEPASTPARAQRLTLKFGQVWPATYPEVGAVTIRMVAGYGAAAGDVPAPVRQAILLLVSHFHEERAPVGAAQLAEMPFAVSALLAPYRCWSF